MPELLSGAFRYAILSITLACLLLVHTAQAEDDANLLPEQIATDLEGMLLPEQQPAERYRRLDAYLRDLGPDTPARELMALRLLEIVERGHDRLAISFAKTHLPFCLPQTLVPRLALLLHSTTGYRDALYVLESLPWPDADTWLIQALEWQDISWADEIIYTLGSRRSAVAVGPLAARLADPAGTQRNAALAALTQVPGPEAAAALRAARPALAEAEKNDVDRALLRHAHELPEGEQRKELVSFLQAEAVDPLVRARIIHLDRTAVTGAGIREAVDRGDWMRLSALLANTDQHLDEDVPRALLSIYEALPLRVRPQALTVFEDHAYAPALDLLHREILNGDTTLRSAAVAAAGSISHPKSINVFLEALNDSNLSNLERWRIRWTLDHMDDSDAVPSMVERLKSAEGLVLHELLRTLAMRDSPELTPMLLEYARSDDRNVWGAVLTSATSLAESENLPQLFDLLFAATDNRKRMSCQEVLRSALLEEPDIQVRQRLLDKAIAEAPGSDTQAVLYRLLPKCVGILALPALLNACESADLRGKAAAFEALSVLPGNAVFEPLLEYSERETDPESRRYAFEATVRALVRADLPDAQMRQSARRLADMAAADLEHTLLLGILGSTKRTAVLQIVQDYLARNVHVQEAAFAFQKILQSQVEVSAARDYQQQANLALDGDLQSGWSSLKAPEETTWIRLDFKTPVRCQFFILNSSTMREYHLPQYHVYLTGAPGEPERLVAEGEGEAVTRVDLGGALLSSLRVEIPETAAQVVWVLNEIQFLDEVNSVGIEPAEFDGQSEPHAAAVE